MQDEIAKTLLQRYERLVSERRPLEQQWQELAEFTNPMRADFLAPLVPGRNRTRQLYDGTAGLAAENLAAGLWGMITNAATEWFRIRPADPVLERNDSVQRWAEEVTRRMRLSFDQAGRRFYGAVTELYADLVTFGSGVFYTEETGDGFYYSCRHLAECFIAENEHEQVDTVFRRFRYTARQAWRRWGEDAGERVKRAMDKGLLEEKFTFLHVVLPREDRDPNRRDTKNMPFASYYIDPEDRRIIAESGYREFPYQVPRWSTRSRNLYGDSPAMLALSDAKMLNAMSKTTIIAAQKAVDPPILAPDETAVRGVRTSPGGIIYGGIDENGRRRYEPLTTGVNVGLGLELEEQRRQVVRDAFFASMLLLAPVPGRTATEVLTQQEEKIRLLGPHLGRVQSEFLDPLLKRQYAMMYRAGLLPPPPEALADSGLRVEYVSPLARAQKTSEGTALVRTLEALAPIANLKPDILDNIDEDALTRAIAEAFGTPVRILRDPAQVEALRAQRQTVQQGADLVEAAGSLSQTARNLAAAGIDPLQAAAMAQGAGSGSGSDPSPSPDETDSDDTGAEESDS